MTGDINRLERQLERATAPVDAPVGGLDAETARLREGWLALGQSLAAAEMPVEQTRIAWRVPGSGHTDRGRQLAWVVAVAASIALVSAAVWAFRSHRAVPTPQVVPERLAADTVGTRGASTAVPSKLPEAETAPPDVDLKWDDSIDTQLAAASLAIERTRSDWQSPMEQFDYARYGLKQVAKDLDESPL